MHIGSINEIEHTENTGKARTSKFVTLFYGMEITLKQFVAPVITQPHQVQMHFDRREFPMKNHGFLDHCHHRLAT